MFVNYHLPEVLCEYISFTRIQIRLYPDLHNTHNPDFCLNLNPISCKLINVVDIIYLKL